MLDGPVVIGSDLYTSLRERTLEFEKKNGRRPRVLLTNMDRGSDGKRVKSFGVVYAEAGFDVDICPAFKTPEIVAKMAVENDVHAVGVVNGGSENRLPETLTAILAGYGALDIQVMAVEAGPSIGSNIAAEPGEALAVRYAEDTLDRLGA
ncbi:hypothetical protein [Desulfospira joergensenii]|uniref:hypothetical protein n=1 Tax=Desulfospira joergensenii TaxID=53329 RepID=UPI0003B6C62B|nr:hypothetical protein [Desulfospira joergensenii]